uniref:NADH-ubiquinone oxidoreductase chain 4 n=1 Tax=Melanobaris laticollis TaxID=1069881 RepID=J9PH37_9CUCU|nr:NADH dehydrogenase subunit 4 [Melanobaris laticollis]
MMILGLLFLIPLVFFSYWLLMVYFFIYSFIFIFKLNLCLYFTGVTYCFSLDLLSFSMIMLSFWICSLMILASEMLYKNNFYWDLFLIMMIFLMLSLFISFYSLNLFIFYIFFEMSLIPTFILIIGWGNQPERVMAGIYLMFYTMFMSLPMLLGLFFLYKSFNSMEFYFLKSFYSVFLYFCINMVFFVKIPMFFIHLWLPKAHVEAPISGSMILAGVMLKLGGYGLLRVMKIFIETGVKLNLGFIIISLIGGLIVSFICIRQSDLKMLIAYSSVSHMGMVLAGILTLNLWGMWGSLILMVAHGLCSSGLFCVANLVYERTGSRSIFLNKGLMNIFPSLSLWWFLLCVSNMAAPPSLNLLGEILLINSLVMYSKISILCCFFLVFYSAVYSLFLYSYTQHGSFYSGIYSCFQINIREYLLLFLHWFPLNILFLKSDFMLWI